MDEESDDEIYVTSLNISGSPPRKLAWSKEVEDMIPDFDEQDTDIELDEAMRAGDVGRMQDLLPRLLFCFAGGGSSHYAIKILELLQGLHKEWTPGVKVRAW